MPAPLAKGLIIAASVLVAAGIAIYESPQVRQWVDQSRRKIAVALQSLGDDIQPRRQSESENDFEERKRETGRRRRNELVRRAREEGVAVDLDELAKIGREESLEMGRMQRGGNRASQNSFDDLVGSDGMLKRQRETAHTTGTENNDTGLRNRATASFAAGAAAAGNPFSDDNILFDHDENETPASNPFTDSPSRASSATLEGDTHISSATAGTLIDLTPENVQTASIPSVSAPASVADEAEAEAAQSFYSFTSDASDDDAENISTGTLTPRSDSGASAFTGASVVDSQADDIAILSMTNDAHPQDDDARSEVFSESGFTEAGFSEAGFSELGEENRGIVTPSSWTDVGSDDESEWGGPAAGGHVSQGHQ
ncbi:hypothetical protein P280DRAFT_470347 [Massarina eburnea CBS 473.64]|uniref:Uncharacterized protein n=1 Tax=Massarina eburnea CBS 473.64 TaxID=1395130 RepID=A0A6A6RWK1_9PLEO|nr:hypothetical protein P280DRAFT_470347 [Massarina eburnea CBS 473.64]